MDLAIQFEQELATRIKVVDSYVENYLRGLEIVPAIAGTDLLNAMIYSATNGGKRFRPVLSLLVTEIYGCPVERILPFATAVELVHTYSLIHDDLPCMDNDDIRRGKPTNHKVYGEDMALLAGDSLLTEAFYLVATAYSDTSYLVGTLTRLLAEAAGIRGMVGGQAIDLRAGKKSMSAEDIRDLHLLKTGALIRVSVEGAAVIAGANPKDTEKLKRFGELLGLAFQISDDILDHGEKDQSGRSFTGIMGLDEAKKYLQQVSSEALQDLRKVSPEATLLEHLIQFNQNRQV